MKNYRTITHWGSQLPFYLDCLKSLIAFCRERIRLQLHTDGTLSQENKDFIHKKLDGTIITITDSSENSSQALMVCKVRPNCQKFRKDSIWGIEFFDPIFAFPDDPITFLSRCRHSLSSILRII